MAGLQKGLVTPAAGLKVEAVTGHFMRRSGIKMLARPGVSSEMIQWWSIDTLVPQFWDMLKKLWRKPRTERAS